MKNPLAVVTVVLGLLAAAFIGLFAFQNHTRTTQLSLDLGFYAAQLDQPLQIPVLMALCVAVGALVPTVYFGTRWWRANTKARRLEQELALSGGGSKDGWR